MRWACILFPQFALDGVLRNRPDPDEPLALLSGPSQRRIKKLMDAINDDLIISSHYSADR